MAETSPVGVSISAEMSSVTNVREVRKAEACFSVAWIFAESEDVGLTAARRHGVIRAGRVLRRQACEALRAAGRC